VYETMRVSEAVTAAPAGFVWTTLSVLVAVYASFAVFFVTLARRVSAGWRRADAAEVGVTPEEGVPYGPRPESFSEASPAPPALRPRGDISAALLVITIGVLVALLASLGFLGAIVLSVFGLRAATRRSLHMLTRG
jgi:hypothetical protein